MDGASIEPNGSKIIAVSNQKGGVGKTTTTLNLGSALAEAGQRVLLIDADPQANLTSYLGLSGAGRTLDEILLAKRPFSAREAREFIQSAPAGLDLIAADQALSGVEHYLISRPDRESTLRRFLSTLLADGAGAYDFVLIDTPPSLSLLTLNALTVAHHVLIPVQPEFFSLEGVVKIRACIEDVRARWNPDLSIIGVLANQVTERRRLTQDVFETLRSELGPLLFESRIRDSAAVTESSGHAKSVLAYRSGSTGAADFRNVAAELLARCGRGALGIRTETVAQPPQAVQEDAS